MIVRTLENLVFRYVAPRGIRYIAPVSALESSGLVAQVYRQMGCDFQLAPPLTVHSPIPELLAGVWAAARESLIAGPADRIARETIAGTVSRINACPYCVDVHSMMLNGAGRHELASAVSSAKSGQISEASISNLIEWAAATRSPGSPVLAAPPFSAADAPQMIGTAVMFHYINRIVNIFLDESPIPFRIPPFIKRLVGSVTMPRIVAVKAASGESLGLLPDSPLPSDLAWSAANPAVSGGFARMATAIDRAGEMTLSASTRELVSSRLRHWRGEDTGLSRRWAEDAIRSLSSHERPVARLALLAAFASHQVDEGVIRACRATGASDAILIAVVAWASFSAVRRVGTWLAEFRA